MPSIDITDALGLDVDGKLSKDAKILKALPSFARLTDLPLDQVPVAEASANLHWTEPIPLTSDKVRLSIGAGSLGSLNLIGPGHRPLDEDDPFSEIQIKDGEIYVALSFTVSLNAELGATLGSATLGFSADRDLELRCYRKFQRGSQGFPKFGQALALTASSFLLLKHVDDLDRLAPHTILVLRGMGTLTVSAGISVSLPTESLASVSLVHDQKFEAKAGGQVAVDASVTITGGYQVRLRRLEGRKTELGVYTIKSRELDLGFSADIGITAAVGPFDLGEAVIGALSHQPTVDVEEFKRAFPGEDDDSKTRRIEGFQSSIGSAISNKLEASLKAKFARVHSNEAVWLFEIDGDRAVSSEAKAAITSAFEGRFGDLTKDATKLPAGITQSVNILTTTELRSLTGKINLLGLVNLISVGKIAQVSTAERNSSGDITLLTDSSSVARLKALLINFGNDRKRLRKMLSENFLITATYRANDVGVLPPGYTAKHTYFEIDDKTSRNDLKNNLDVCRVLGLLKAEDAAAYMGGRKDFGRTEFYVETRYDSEAVRDAFLKPGGAPPSRDEYEKVGRSSLRGLLAGDPGQEFRTAVAEDDAVWKQMKGIGNRAQFAPLFGLRAGTLDPRVEAAGADYSVITSWAEAMVEAGKATQEVDELLSGDRVAGDDPKLTKARKVLNEKLTGVLKNTKEEFGDPLGMVMFYAASNYKAGITIIMSGDQVQRLELSATASLAAHG